METHSHVALYQQTIWGHEFIKGLDTNFSNCKEEVEKAVKLEEQVNIMLMDYENEGSSTLPLLDLIDDIERLGLGHRFQTSITRVLLKISSKNAMKEEEETNLHEVSLKFRLLRQHGYSVTQEFPRIFKDNVHDGFIGCLHTDVKALLSIYEASYLALEGELDLHAAKIFATENLLKLIHDENEVIDDDQINHALDVPLYRRMHRLQARWYINAYGKRKDSNQLLLELAILDFNMIQLVHKRDLQKVSRWWKNIGLASKLSFIRDRIVECLFWTVGMVYEPQYSSCRVGLTKLGALITTVDDIYDVYGSLDELNVFTNAIKRWDINAVQYMPEYLQVGFLALYNTINEMGYDTLLAQGKNIIPVLIDVWGEFSEALLVEAKWTYNNYMPALEDYLDNAWRSVSGVVILTHGYFLMNHEVKEDVVESLKKFHNLFKWSSMIFRLHNDLATSSVEIARGKTANAISCYMYEHGVGEEVACKYLKTLIDKAWMNLIEARVGCSVENLADPFVELAINLARVSHCTYQHGDGHGAPDARAKNRILSVIIDPIPNEQKEHQ